MLGRELAVAQMTMKEPHMQHSHLRTTIRPGIGEPTKGLI